MSLFRIVNHVLSPGGRHGRLTIMIFHRVLHQPDPLMPSEPDAATFEMRLRHVGKWFNILPLEDSVERLAQGTLPPRALAITFDDGYADNHDVALPILRRLGIHATFFVATGFIDGGCMWNDKIIETIRRYSGETLDLAEVGLGRVSTVSLEQRRSAIDRLIGQLKYRPTSARLEVADRIASIAGVAIPTGLMMTSAQVRELGDAGMGIGAHTHYHPILASLDAHVAREEIARSKQVLEEITRRPVRLFAYPNGKPGKDYTYTNVEQVRALGFIAAFSTATGAARTRADLLQLPRFTPWDRQAWKFGVRLSRNLWHDRYELA